MPGAILYAVRFLCFLPITSPIETWNYCLLLLGLSFSSGGLRAGRPVPRFLSPVMTKLNRFSMVATDDVLLLTTSTDCHGPVKTRSNLCSHDRGRLPLATASAVVEEISVGLRHITRPRFLLPGSVHAISGQASKFTSGRLLRQPARTFSCRVH